MAVVFTFSSKFTVLLILFVPILFFWSNSTLVFDYSASRVSEEGIWTENKIVCSTICNTAYTLTWLRPPHTVPYRPKRIFSLSTVLCTFLLLLSGNVELNPGPKCNDILIGSLNTRSAISHAAEVCDLVCSESLDVAALCETRTRIGQHDAINRDFVPDGYDVINDPRTDGRRGGGLAILFRSSLNVVNVVSKSTRTTYDLLLAAIDTGGDRILLANIYRPPDTNLNTFFEELADLFDEFSGGRIVFAGDLNCPGASPYCVDTRLDVLLSCYNLVAVNDGPTHLHHNGRLNKLDLMFEPESD